MLLWFSRLPLTLRLPLLVAVLIFLAAVATTQVAIRSSASQLEAQMERIGQVYLDGLAAALMPALAQNDVTAMTDVLQRALAVHVGIKDRRLAVIDAGGRLIAQAQREDTGGGDGPAWQPPAALQAGGADMSVDDGSVWVWRYLPLAAGSDGPGTIVANLDITGFVQERRQLRWTLLLFDLLFSAVCAAIGFLLARQLQRPVTLMTKHLVLAEGELPQPIAAQLIPAHDPQMAQFIQAFNRMAENAAQREAMLGRLVDQERDAVIGRLAATLAHEIRNPLGGIATAIGTLRKFGEQPEARTEAVDFIERGVVALQEVTDATLKTHRPTTAARRLRLQDLHDVRLLAAADAGRRDVTVEVDADLPVEVGVPATEVRQLLLNLLLNAVRATSPGGVVILRGRLQQDILLLEVIDQGSGLEAELARGITSGVPPPGNPGLGVAIIVRLVERLRGRVSVNSRSEGGTHIALRLPVGSAASFAGGMTGADADA